MKRAIGYCRVSTTEQAAEGISLSAQEEKIRLYCAHKQLALEDVIVDAAVSGGSSLASRPGGAKLEKLKTDAIISVKLDRLFRDAGDCLNVTKEWQRRSVALHILDFGGDSLDTSTPMGRFFLTMSAGFAELERAVIRDRTRMALQFKRRQNKLVGGVPFGFTLDADGETLRENADEQSALKEIKALHADKKSLREIARILAARGVRTKQGKHHWHASAVRSVLLHSH